MRAIEDQQPIETPRADGPHKSLGHPVLLRRAKRCANDLDPLAAKHLVKRAGEFLVPIANQESNRFRPVRQGPPLSPEEQRPQPGSEQRGFELDSALLQPQH